MSRKLAVHLGRIARVRLLAWGHSQVFLPLIIPWFAVYSVVMLLRQKSDVIYIGDPVLSPLAVLLKGLFKVPVAVTVHGRDVAFANRVYQRFLPHLLNSMDCVVCVSDHIRRECVARGVHEASCVVIPNGVCVGDFSLESSEELDLVGRIASLFNLADRLVLLTVGRLVEKKGIHYFIGEVLPRVLDRLESVVYVVVGDGPWRGRIEAVIEETNLGDSVLMVGELPMDSTKLRAFYNLADLFVMPNVRIDGDVEGFGVVALEACAAACWVVASRVDGIEDAVTNGQNGALVEARDTEGLGETLIELLSDTDLCKRLGSQARDFVAQNYNWEHIASLYHNAFLKIIESHSGAS